MLGADALPLLEIRRERLDNALHESVARLAAGDANHFTDALPSSALWRVFPEFRDAVAYVDIETTGLGSPGDCITTIALYDGRSVHTYVQGHNLRDFCRDIERYNLLRSS